MTTLREFLLPDLGEGLTESDVVAWRVAEGDHVALNQVIAEVETAKALVELPSPVEGVIAELHAEPGQTVSVGEPLVTFEVEGDAAADPVSAPEVGDASGDEDEKPQPNLVGYGAGPERSGRPTRRPRRIPAAAVPAPDGPPTRSTPPVRKLAADRGVDLAGVAGSGPHGLVTREDVLEAAAPPRAPQPGELRIPIRGVRKHTAAAMVASAFTAPHVSEWMTVDVTPLVELLERLRDHPVTGGRRITLLALVARATCLVLRRHPELNSSWDEAAQEIVQHGTIGLGIAAATERGLVVPHIPDAGSLPLLELAVALNDLTEEARAGRTPPSRLSGGTFTITNIGVFGVDGGTPILNPGEAGILAVGAMRRQPWEFEGGIALRHVLTLSLSFDHRIVDGEQGSRFLAEVAGLLGDPALGLVIA